MVLKEEARGNCLKAAAPKQGRFLFSTWNHPKQDSPKDTPQVMDVGESKSDSKSDFLKMSAFGPEMDYLETKACGQLSILAGKNKLFGTPAGPCHGKRLCFLDVAFIQGVMLGLL